MLSTKNVRGRNTFYPEVLHVELQEYRLQDLGQRSSSAMGLISKTGQLQSHLSSYFFASSMTIFAQGGVTFNYIILKNLIPYFIFYLLAALSLAR